jgi:hypothetical protein
VRLLAAGLLALTACGRIRFDERHVPRDGAPADMMLSAAHDEDGDGIPDADDPCPHVPGDATDTDGDGVGDDCDVDAGTPDQHWLLFSTLQPGDEPFDDLTGFVQEADSVRGVADEFPGIAVSFAKARIDVGWEIHALTGAGQHQISFGCDDSTGANDEYYFSELNENDPTRDAAIVAYDSVSGYQALSEMDPGPLHAGTGYNRIDMDPAATVARIGWSPSQFYDLSAPAPGYAHTDLVRFSLHGVDVSLRYVAIIGSD